MAAAPLSVLLQDFVVVRVGLQADNSGIGPDHFEVRGSEASVGPRVQDVFWLIVLEQDV